MTGWAQVVLDLSAPPAEDFWAVAFGWPLGPAWADHPELRSFEPEDGDTYVHRQRVGGPAGVHLDLEVDDLATATGRLVDLGAAVVRVTTDLMTLTSPAGLHRLPRFGARPRGDVLASGHGLAVGRNARLWSLPASSIRRPARACSSCSTGSVATMGAPWRVPTSTWGPTTSRPRPAVLRHPQQPDAPYAP